MSKIIVSGASGQCGSVLIKKLLQDPSIDKIYGQPANYTIGLKSGKHGVFVMSEQPNQKPKDGGTGFENSGFAKKLERFGFDFRYLR